jgi:hypothetical protein
MRRPGDVGQAANEGGQHVSLRSKIFHDSQDPACLHCVHRGNHRAAGDSANSLFLTQETGRQLGIIMALVFGIVTIVEAFMAPPEAIISDRLFGDWRTAPDSPLMGMHKSGE